MMNRTQYVTKNQNIVRFMKGTVMPDSKSLPQTPAPQTPQPATVTLEVPKDFKGSPEAYRKMMEKNLNLAKRGKSYDKAIQNAVKRLKDSHPEEFETYKQEEAGKLGITIRTNSL